MLSNVLKPIYMASTINVKTPHDYLHKNITKRKPKEKVKCKKLTSLIKNIYLSKFTDNFKFLYALTLCGYWLK